MVALLYTIYYKLSIYFSSLQKSRDLARELLISGLNHHVWILSQGQINERNT